MAEESQYLKTTCGNCQQKIEFPDELYSQTFACPTCGVTIQALRDDEKEDPEQDREWLENDLSEGQQEGIYVPSISEADKKAMLLIQVVTGYSSVFDLVAEKFPQLLTKAGKQQLKEEQKFKAELEAEYNKEHRLKQFAPPIFIEKLPPRGEDDRDATENQIKYLRDLGLRDENTLAQLSLEQGSKLIDAILKERDKAGIPKHTGQR